VLGSLHAIGHDGTLTSVDRALFAELGPRMT